jgi:hypothetical protein
LYLTYSPDANSSYHSNHSGGCDLPRMAILGNCKTQETSGMREVWENKHINLTTLFHMSHRIYTTPFASVYPHYVNKIEKKGRSVDELHLVITWLTGYSEKDLEQIIENKTTFESFFGFAPALNPNAHKITGMICGHRIEEITDPLMQQIRWLDKLVDELAKGRSLEKILRA